MGDPSCCRGDNTWRRWGARCFLASSAQWGHGPTAQCWSKQELIKVLSAVSWLVCVCGKVPVCAVSMIWAWKWFLIVFVKGARVGGLQLMNHFRARDLDGRTKLSGAAGARCRGAGSGQVSPQKRSFSREIIITTVSLSINKAATPWFKKHGVFILNGYQIF